MQGRILALVPEDGVSISNKEIRHHLGLDLDEYLRICEPVIDADLILRGRGQGGTVRRVVQAPPPPETVIVVDGAVIVDDTAVKRSAEASLYGSMRDVIDGVRAKTLGQRLLGTVIIARAGRRPTGGYWTRPDIVTVEVLTPKYRRGRYLNISSFEVKQWDSIDVRAVYEALAHRRSVTHSWVLLHVPAEHRAALQPTIDEVVREAAVHGIGVIVAAEPGNYDAWEEFEDARRVEPDPDRLDEFIDCQLDKVLQTEILRWI